MTSVLREMTHDAAEAILAGKRPAKCVWPTTTRRSFRGRGAGRRRRGAIGPFFLHRAEDDLVVGEIGGAFVDDEGTIEIGFAVVQSQWNRGYATAAVAALVTKAREALEVRRIVAHTPLQRPRSGHVLEKAGLPMCGRWTLRTRRGTSCASSSGSWRSSSSA
jgi:anhydro-N-acetylmuramic acid kinase